MNDIIIKLPVSQKTVEKWFWKLAKIDATLLLICGMLAWANLAIMAIWFNGKTTIFSDPKSPLMGTLLITFSFAPILIFGALKNDKIDILKLILLPKYPKLRLPKIHIELEEK